jgi:hypothetical protein
MWAHHLKLVGEHHIKGTCTHCGIGRIMYDEVQKGLIVIREHRIIRKKR